MSYCSYLDYSLYSCLSCLELGKCFFDPVKSLAEIVHALSEIIPDMPLSLLTEEVSGCNGIICFLSNVLCHVSFTGYLLLP